jgi:hypothetical protein
VVRNLIGAPAGQAPDGFLRPGTVRGATLCVASAAVFL